LVSTRSSVRKLNAHEPIFSRISLHLVISTHLLYVSHTSHSLYNTHLPLFSFQTHYSYPLLSVFFFSTSVEDKSQSPQNMGEALLADSDQRSTSGASGGGLPFQGADRIIGCTNARAGITRAKVGAAPSTVDSTGLRRSTVCAGLVPAPATYGDKR